MSGKRDPGNVGSYVCYGQRTGSFVLNLNQPRAGSSNLDRTEVERRFRQGNRRQWLLYGDQADRERPGLVVGGDDGNLSRDRSGRAGRKRHSDFPLVAGIDCESGCVEPDVGMVVGDTCDFEGRITRVFNREGQTDVLTDQSRFTEVERSPIEARYGSGDRREEEVDGRVDSRPFRDIDDVVNHTFLVDDHDVLYTQTPGDATRAGALKEWKVDTCDSLKRAQLRRGTVPEIDSKHLDRLGPVAGHDFILHERRRRSTEASVVPQQKQEENLTSVLTGVHRVA